MHAVPKTTPRERKELALLFDVSQALHQSMDLRHVVTPILTSLREHLDMQHGTLTLLNRRTGEIFIEVGLGLSETQRERGRYRIGEGITGKVVQSGEPAVIPHLSKHPDFLNRTGALKNPRGNDVSFLCIPIQLADEVIGTLSVTRSCDTHMSLQEDVRLLTIVASMIAQAVRLRQAAEEERQQLLHENTRLHQELRERFHPANIIGNASAMQEVYDLIRRVSASHATVLIRGESGTGKELIAHAIHYNSPRANHPFIQVHCASLPESLLESELFGHEKGAFTGAMETRVGRFEEAQGGTVFLDEVGDFSPAIQVKLLRVLQERQFSRIGSNQIRKTDVRILAATNRDLEALIQEEKFRQDIYYRLNVISIHVPPLRDRKSDIPLLADFFTEKYGRANRKNVRRISTPAIDILMSYHWPGNVRELENCIERAVLLTDNDVIHAHHLPPTLQTAQSSNTFQTHSLQAALDNMEKNLIIDALKSCRGNQSKAAKSLGLTERMMGLRIKKHHIHAKNFRTFS